MAKLAVLNNANNPIGTPVTIPDSFVTFIRRVVGGQTNAETADAFLAAIVPLLRQHYRELRRIQLEKTALDSADTELDAEWPG